MPELHGVAVLPVEQTAYKDLLTFWEDADSDVPLVQQAEAEYRKLRGIVRFRTTQALPLE